MSTKRRTPQWVPVLAGGLAAGWFITRGVDTVGVRSFLFGMGVFAVIAFVALRGWKG